MSGSFQTIKEVDIDLSGTFKYVLIELYDKLKDGQETNEDCKLLVRGYSDCEYHADIYDRVEEEEVRKIGLDCQCLGGGRIIHDPDKKFIKVYGYSMGFGRADHSKTVEILKKTYKDYNIEFSNEGY